MAEAVSALTQVAATLAEAFPELDVTPVRALETGFGSLAIETSDGIIFRIARTDGAAAGHAREARLLPALRSRLPVAVPDPRWVIAPQETSLVHGAIGYERLPGERLSPEHVARADASALAADVAGFLVALHAFPLEEARRLGLPDADRAGAEFAELRSTVLPLLRDALTRTEYGTVSNWCADFAADAAIDAFPPALRHGDLWYGNLLVDEERGRVGAVLDWEAAAVGDAASDLARQLHLGSDFARAVISDYEARGGGDPGLRRRIARRWELLEFSGVRTAAELDDPEELDETFEKLRAGPILSGAIRLE